MFKFFKKKYSQEELDAIVREKAIESAKQEANKIFEMIGRNEIHKGINDKPTFNAFKEALAAFNKTIVSTGLTDSDFNQYDSNDSTSQVGAFKVNMAKFFHSYQVMRPEEAGMMSRHWLIGKAVSMPIKTALRRGFKIDGKHKDVIEKEVKRHSFYKRLEELGVYARSMGGALMFFKTYDSDKFSQYSKVEYYEAPFNINSITEGNRLSVSVFDSYFAIASGSGEGFNDPLSDYYYEPEFYNVRGLRVHRSHFVKYVPYQVVQFLKPYYKYYGISVPERVMEKVYAAESSQLEGLALLKTKRLLTLQIPDLVDRDEARVQQAMTMIANAMNNFSFMLLDGATNVAQHDVSLTDLESTIMMNYQLVASAADVPADQLIGTSPKGFNTTGEYQQDVYHGFVEGVQDDLAEACERFFDLSRRILNLDEDVSFKFNPLVSPTDAEIATINEINARTTQILVTIGAVSPEEARDHYNSDDNSFLKDKLDAELDMELDYEVEEQAYEEA